MIFSRLLLAWVQRRSDHRVSDRWLRAYAQQESRVTFHGPAWNWRYLIDVAKRKRRHGLRRVA